MNKRKTASNEQLELEFLGATRRANALVRRENRAARAAWWFAQMRQIVSQAIDWDAAPEPRPEQSWLGFPRHRQFT